MLRGPMIRVFTFAVSIAERCRSRGAANPAETTGRLEILHRATRAHIRDSEAAIRIGVITRCDRTTRME